MQRVFGSFRDPSGYVYDDGKDIYRTVNRVYQSQWESMTQSGFLTSLAAAEKVCGYSELALDQFPDAVREQTMEALGGAAENDLFEGGFWKLLEVDRLPFISYPYEWSFDQLKDAALLTLELQKEALKHELSSKDASAYNIQFRGAKPLFIDLLSFDHYREGDTWQGYRQFCMHFLAPLALYRHDLYLGGLSRLWIDGIPLSVASSLLPWKTKFSLGLQMHIHTHARLERKHSDGRQARDKVEATRLSKKSLLNIVDSLESTVRALKFPQSDTEWGEYYSDTNYTSAAEAAKEKIVDELAARCACAGGMAADLGANTGKYSALLAKHYDYVIAADIDPAAVNSHYNYLKKDGNKKILPLVMDLSNPSPGLGWMCRERASFAGRCKADFVTALALIHHLRFTAGIPFPLMAEFFAEHVSPGGYLLIEFVPRDDSQVQRLLAARDDIFSDYTLEVFQSAFAGKFEREEVIPVADSLRSLILFRKKS
ncbi:MAG: hypothetical protein IJD04_07200 [Desulfovibrionaceae bacterium]|nr:hypothetical protein [Desulfovibrionaceae bacterium]